MTTPTKGAAQNVDCATDGAASMTPLGCAADMDEGAASPVALNARAAEALFDGDLGQSAQASAKAIWQRVKVELAKLRSWGE